MEIRARFFFVLFFISLLNPSKTVLSAPAAQIIPNFAFTNQDGKTFHLYDFKGKYIFVSFIYTRCPMKSMCPLTTSLTMQLVEKWKKLKDKRPLHILIVTLDPQFDTPKVLKNYAKKYHSDSKVVTFATGNPQTLADFESYFDVLAIPEGGMINHNVESVLLSPELKNLKEFYENKWAPQDVLDFIRKNPARNSH